MSDLLDGVLLDGVLPTVSSLYYLLGNISHSWERIAKELGISSDQVERIKADCANCNMRMIEAFDVWLSADVDCNWDKVIKVLNTMDESLAAKVHHYIREVGRIEGSWQSRGFDCDWVKPLKNLSYDQWWLKETCCQDDVLAHSSIEDCKKEVLDCLSDYTSKWYEIGIALKIPKNSLDQIKLHDLRDGDMRYLSNMIDIAIKEQFTWRKLINALLEIELSRAAHCLEREAKTKYVLKNFFWNVFQKKDFFSRSKKNTKQEEKYYSQLREILGLSSEVSNDDIWDDFHRHILDKNLTLSDRKEVVNICKNIQNVCSEHSKEIELRVKDLEGRMNTAKEVVNNLQEQKTTLELSKRNLISDKKELSEAIQDISNSNKLSMLEKKHKSIDDQLKKVCNELEKCIHDLHFANADYKSIYEQLTNCRDELTKCKILIAKCKAFIETEYRRTNTKMTELQESLEKLTLEASDRRETRDIDEKTMEDIEEQKEKLEDEIVEIAIHFKNLAEDLENTKETLSSVDERLKEAQRVLHNGLINY